MSERMPRLTVTLYPDLAEDVESLMQATGRRKSQVIRDAVEVGLKELKRQKSKELEQHESIKLEIPIVHIFSDNGKPTTVASDSTGKQLPLATLDEVEWSGRHLGYRAATEGWQMRLQEGIKAIKFDNEGMLIWIDAK
jgi:Arc/MetJ-type ribon-helix-helix transcriptional regulator